ncbi:glycosyltransferase family 4 protein [Bifidobacterium sp. 82T24]|uniref:glycosyltransferase family 4 protein n=1 Tax=Bifidobacterium pluvialisilvae TaxID=2834436 RepID=UPI001C59F4E5|nr:glycosyltransferase family 4 protein [Bifidobacterium pluvialisilvae]MBW3087481.1 glycosyltransferase family 4 protein [Bifidobacterium pluvialisilvae]
MTRRIAFFSGDITRSGGTENVSIMIANALVDSSRHAGRGDGRAEESFAICFISLFEERAEPFFAIDERIARHTVYPTVTHGIQHYFDTVRRLRKLVERHDIDVLVDIDGILDMYSLPLRRGTGVKVISWEHFNFNQNPGVPYRKLTRRWAARRADAIVTLTEADKRLYGSNLRLRCPIVAIPNPMQTITPEPQYDADSRMILSSGRLTYQKGFDMLVDVAAKVLPQHPGWRWVVPGEGEDRAMLERKTEQAGLAGRLVFPGRVDNMGDYYRKAAMFVMTSRFEGLPMVLLEAKAHRLPIVSFDCETGPAEIVADGVNGVLTAVGDIDATAAAINRLIDDAERRKTYAAHALDDADRFGKPAIIEQWRTLLNNVSK